MFKSQQIISAQGPILSLTSPPPPAWFTFEFAVIYCSACASKLALNPHSCGSDSCSRVQLHRFNAWIRWFRVWAMASFWLKWENGFTFNLMLAENTYGVAHTHRSAGVCVCVCMCVWQIKAGKTNKKNINSLEGTLLTQNDRVTCLAMQLRSVYEHC